MRPALPAVPSLTLPRSRHADVTMT